jgi:predicted nucleic acid-binding protein
VSGPQRTTHVVLDTDVTSWLLHPDPLPHADAAREIIGNRSPVVSFVTVTELRYGALRAGWGDFRLRRLERSLTAFDVIETNDPLTNACAQLRAWAQRSGHGIAQKIHEADRWVATTALALNLELLAGDGIYEGVDGLDVQRIRPNSQRRSPLD